MRSTLLACLLLASSACTINANENEQKPPQLSNTLKLDQINGSNGAFSDGKKLEIFVAMLGPEGFVKLGDGDTITVDVNGNTVPTRERIEDNKVHYIAEVTSPPTEPIVTTTLSRASGEKAVGKNSLAPAFELKSPPTTAKIGDAVTVDIEPRPDPARAAKLRHRFEVRGTCVDKEKQTLDAPATYPLSLDLRNLQIVGDAGCEVEVQVRIETNGEPYTGFKGGGFEGLQHRTFKLALTK
jgi:hypothetical protein